MATSADATRVGRRVGVGGAAGNARLTAFAGAVLLVLLAVEGSTIPFMGPLLSVHIFVGMLLLGPVALKLASTGYRFARYYGGARAYVELGPPAPLMRVLVAPVLVLSTLTLFGTGVLLLVTARKGAILTLHQASFIVWIGACGIHVLVYALRAFRQLAGRHLSGDALRIALVLAGIGAGVVVAVATYHLAGPWLQHTLGADR
jgi:hypothetical protein